MKKNVCSVTFREKKNNCEAKCKNDEANGHFEKNDEAFASLASQPLQP